MKWKRIPAPLPEMDLWGAISGEVSFVVSFDARHPQYGYIASYRRTGEQTVYVDKHFTDRKSAKQAAVHALMKANN